LWSLSSSRLPPSMAILPGQCVGALGQKVMRVLLRSLLTPAATCLIVAAACTTLRPVGVDELRGPNPPERVRVTKTDDSTVALHSPRVVGDTLVGTADGVRRTLLLSQATAIQAWEPAPNRTAILIFAGMTGAFALLVAETTAKTPQLDWPCYKTSSGGCQLLGRRP
jgi:hypothetical protein